MGERRKSGTLKVHQPFAGAWSKRLVYLTLVHEEMRNRTAAAWRDK